MPMDVRWVDCWVPWMVVLSVVCLAASLGEKRVDRKDALLAVR